jgi:hypothetical protein
MTRRNRIIIAVFVAVSGGIFIGRIDTSPRWDDTPLTVFTLMLVSATGTFIARRKPWLIAILVALWVPLLNVIKYGHWASVFAFLPALVSAYLTFLAIEKSELI